MFRGAYQVTLDQKQRVSVPVGFRPLLLHGETEKVVLARHIEKCLLAFPTTEYQKIVDKLDARPAFDDRANRLRRWLIANAYELSLDKQGRILVPQFLREYADLNGEVLMAGVGPRFEVWSAAAWKEREGKDSRPESTTELRQDLNELGL